MKKIELHVFQGMQRDSSISLLKAEFLWEANNIRLTPREGDTMLSMTNERGPEKISFTGGNTMVGSYVGHCVIGDYLTVFTHNKKVKEEADYIYRIKKNEDDSYTLKCIAESLNLNFSTDHPLLTIGVYENEYIQKVYWTDGINQPRVINITKDLLLSDTVAKDYYTDYSFDFVPKMDLKDSIHIQRVSDSSAQFGAGVIQYAVSYYNKYGLQSNISCVSPLIPTSFSTRAGSAEEKIGNAFKVTIKNPDTHFEYLRLYSIFRSSKDTTPVAKRVADVFLGYGGNSGEEILITDNNTIGEDIDATELMYIGGESITAGTICQKDGTLFLGDVNVKRQNIDENLKEEIKNSLTVASDYRYAYYPMNFNSDTYKWGNSLNAKEMTIDNKIGITLSDYNIPTAGFKAQERYRLGLLFQHNTGKWSEPIYITDAIEENKPKVEEFLKLVTGKTTADSYYEQVIPTFKATLGQGTSINGGSGQIIDKLLAAGYVRVRTVMALPNASDRQIIAQGVLAPTVVNNAFKETHSPDVLSSWFFRPWLKDENWNLATKSSSSSTRANISNAEELTITGTVSTTSSRNLRSYTIKGTIYGIVNNTGSFKGTLSGVTATGTISSIDYQSKTSITASAIITTVTGTISGVLVADASTEGSSISEGGSYFKNAIYGADLQYKDGYFIYSDKPTKALNMGSEILGVTNISQDNYSSYKSSDGDKEDNTLFYVSQHYLTMHSPELGKDSSMNTMDVATLKCRLIGLVPLDRSVGDIDIQTSSTTIGEGTTGFYHKMLASTQGAKTLCAGWFYRDDLVDDMNTDQKDSSFKPWNDEDSGKIKYMKAFRVYPWHRSGSLNNDINRPSGAGTRTAVLQRKVISNLKFSDLTEWKSNTDLTLGSGVAIDMFNSDEVQQIKVSENNYYGNIDLLISPDKYGLIVDNGDKVGLKQSDVTLDFSDAGYYMGIEDKGLCYKGNSSSDYIVTNIGNYYEACRVTRDPVRMKYKSTPHALIVLGKDSNNKDISLTAPNGITMPTLYMAELYRDALDTDYSGSGDEALKQNLWIPTSDAVLLGDGSLSVKVTWDYGDTWYQRWDCLKTYSFTNDDPNSVIEIASFMVESHENIDGRYDRNRGLSSNLSISPTNFNLINPVYSLLDDFFNYRLQDNDYYSLTSFPSMVTWSTEKSNASEVDPWTTVTLASTLEIDGTKGKVTDIVTHADLLYAFQEHGVSRINFNVRVLIPTSDGVPVEISNSYKVDGYNYISTAVGSTNKFSVLDTATGIYFVDHIGNVLYILSTEGLQNISDKFGFNYWFSEQDTENEFRAGNFYIGSSVSMNTALAKVATIGGVSTNNTISLMTLPYTTFNSSSTTFDRTAVIENKQTPTLTINSWRDIKGMALYYDFNKKDLYVSTQKSSLCFSDYLGQFVSFMSYQGGVLFNIGSTFNALTNYNDERVDLWRMFSGEYNEFFYKHYPTDFTFISNQDSTEDKIFTNLETRVDFYKDSVLQHDVFFDTLLVWNEYQNTGEETLTFKKYPYSTSSVASNAKKKFRIWRCDIPRALKTVTKNGRSISKRSLDRIRNTWCKVKLTMNKTKNLHMDMHDMSVIYYS